MVVRIDYEREKSPKISSSFWQTANTFRTSSPYHTCIVRSDPSLWAARFILPLSRRENHVTWTISDRILFDFFSALLNRCVGVLDFFMGRRISVCDSEYYKGVHSSFTSRPVPSKVRIICSANIVFSICPILREDIQRVRPPEPRCEKKAKHRSSHKERK